MNKRTCQTEVPCVQLLPGLDTHMDTETVCPTEVPCVQLVQAPDTDMATKRNASSDVVLPSFGTPTDTRPAPMDIRPCQTSMLYGQPTEAPCTYMDKKIPTPRNGRSQPTPRSPTHRIQRQRDNRPNELKTKLMYTAPATLYTKTDTMGSARDGRTSLRTHQSTHETVVR